MIRKASGVATVLRREVEDWPILEIAWSRGSGLRLKLDPRTWLPCVSDLPNSTNWLSQTDSTRGGISGVVLSILDNFEGYRILLA
jgi:hypothetical protein